MNMQVSLDGPEDRGPDKGHGQPDQHLRLNVTVNGKPVVLTKHRMTGLEIKQAAIAQGVAIELTFILQEELPNGHQKIIGDNDPVEVRNHDRFTAIHNDDNS